MYAGEKRKEDPQLRAQRMKNLKNYGLKIKKYREQNNMTAEELAGCLQVALSSVRNWECGISRPDLEHLVRMFSVFHVDPNTFFGIRGVGAALTEPEKQMLDKYRAMDPYTQGEFEAIGMAMLGMEEYSGISPETRRTGSTGRK